MSALKFVALALVVVCVSAAGPVSPLPPAALSPPIQSVTCSQGFYTTAVCSRLRITHPSLQKIFYEVGVIQPAGTPTKTIVTHGGGNGDQPMDYGLVQQLLDKNIRVIQLKVIVVSSGDIPAWEYAGSAYTKNILTASSRPAALLKIIFENFHPEGKNKGFGVWGQSGGSAALENSLFWYDTGSFIDFALITSGSVFGSLVQHCDVRSTNVTVCPVGQYGCTSAQFGQQVPYDHSPVSQQCDRASGQGADKVGWWTGFDCGCPEVPTQAALDSWALQSTKQAGMAASLPKTAVSVWSCDNAGWTHSTLNSGAQGQIVAAGFTSSVIADFSHVVVRNCGGAEGVWGGVVDVYGVTTNSGQAMANLLDEKTIPRHL